MSREAEKNLNFKAHKIRPLESFSVGPYLVTAFPANHAPGMGAMLYAIEAGGHVVFYGTDTAVLLEETCHVFRQRKMRFDCCDSGS